MDNANGCTISIRFQPGRPAPPSGFRDALMLPASGSSALPVKQEPVTIPGETAHDLPP